MFFSIASIVNGMFLRYAFSTIDSIDLTLDLIESIGFCSVFNEYSLFKIFSLVSTSSIAHS